MTAATTRLLVAAAALAASVVALPLLILVLACGLAESGGMTAGQGGNTRLAWAEQFAARLGAPSRDAVHFLLAWTTDEGARPYSNNPLNTSLPEPGSLPLPGNSDGVRMYPTLDIGLAAAVATITTPDPGRGYQPIVESLRRDDLPTAAAALQQSSWCVNPLGPLGHECPGYGATILGIAQSYADPGVLARDGQVPAGTTSLTGATDQTAPEATGARLATLFTWLSAQLGKPYIWGGTGPVGFDCSGLAMMAYAQIGVTLPRTAAEQYAATSKTAVPLSQAQPGDLVFWANKPSDPATIHHVAVFAGGGRIIEAAAEGVPIHDVPIWNDGGLLPYATRPLAAGTK